MSQKSSRDASRPPAPRLPKRGLLPLALALLLLTGVIAGALWLRASKRPAEPARAPAASARSAPSTASPGGGAQPPSAAGGSGGAAAGAPLPPLTDDPPDLTLEAQKSALLERMEQRLGLSGDSLGRVKAILEGSKWLSQGNPKITQHAMTRSECEQLRAQAAVLPAGDPRCGAPNMVPLYNPTAGESAADARVCIDQFEFPNIACDYPLIWVRASEAALLCRALDKRICDAHEWEGACAGALLPVETEYAFGERRMMMEYLHNKKREITWAYGPQKRHATCATGSSKSPSCSSIDWGVCGSNTYPAGAFPDCRSRFGVFDLHGNAAEHMNLPLGPEQLAGRGGLGETEMKGSWFIFSALEAHPDDCRWRALMWHKSRVDDPASHRNYHLGFRCCKDL